MVCIRNAGYGASLEANKIYVALPDEDASPSRASEAVAIVARPGQRLPFDDTRYRTVTPGRIRAVSSAVVSGRRLGELERLTRSEYYSAAFPAAELRVDAGRVLEYLQYRAEGTCFVRLAGVVFDADPCPAHDRSRFRVEAEPVVEWWIHVSLGQDNGWLLVTEKAIRVVDRAF